MQRSKRSAARVVILWVVLALSVFTMSGAATAASGAEEEPADVVYDELTYQDFLNFLRQQHMAAIIRGVGKVGDLASFYEEAIGPTFGPFVAEVTGQEFDIATLVWVWHGW